MKQIPIVALCGFLGSGKTTLLRRWRRDEALRDAAMIVHDLSDLGFDAELLSADEKTPKAGGLNGRVAALHGDHAIGQLQSSLRTSFEEIAELDPAAPLVLAESTGAARPWPLIQALTQDDRYFLRHFIVTVDALNLHRDFQDGLALTRESLKPQDQALRKAAEVLAEQIAFASVLIITKIDTVPEATLEKQVNNLQKLQPNITIGLSARAGLLLPQLDGTPAPDLQALEERAIKCGLTDETSVADAVEVTILNDPRPFHPERLHAACQNHLGTGLYRTKGFLWMASRPGDVLLWQQAGSHISLELKGQWRAEVVKNLHGSLLPEEVQELERRLAERHPVYGDRCNELTLIGLERDRQAFLAALEHALCTEEEIEAWQEGHEFFDPWPTQLRHTD